MRKKRREKEKRKRKEREERERRKNLCFEGTTGRISKKNNNIIKWLVTISNYTLPKIKELERKKKRKEKRKKET